MPRTRTSSPLLRRVGPLALLGVGLIAARRVVDRVRAARFSWRGKVVLVTGGSRGLGLVIARLLAKRGAKLVLAARDPAALRRAKGELEQHGAEVLDVACDVGRHEQVDDLVRRAQARFGTIDVLINVAGIIEVGPLDTMHEVDFRRSMDTHFFGPLRLALAVLPEMRERGEGHIVNVTSLGGLIAVPHLAPYTASKHGLVGLSRALAAELAGSGVHVLTVSPGLMRTGSPINATFHGDATAEHGWFEVADSLPGLTMSAERAARKIVDACAAGRSSLILGWPAKLAVAAQALMPRLFGWTTAAVGRALPGTPKYWRPTLGRDAESPAIRALSLLSRRAASDNNEAVRPKIPPRP
jgi:short-subunit dehydrogenase